MPSPLRQAPHEVLGVNRCIGARLTLVREEARVVPAGFAIGPPADRQSPARQLFAGVPLALAQVQEPLRPIALLQSQQKVEGVAALGRTERGRVPLGSVPVVD